MTSKSRIKRVRVQTNPDYKTQGSDAWRTWMYGA